MNSMDHTTVIAQRLRLLPQRLRCLPWMALGFWSLVGCEQIIGADFDPKTVYPKHFGPGGQGGQGGAEDRKESAGDGDMASGDGDVTSGDGDMASGDGDGDEGSGGSSGSGAQENQETGGDPGSGGTEGSGGDPGSGGMDGSGGNASGGTDGSGGDAASGGMDGSGGDGNTDEPCVFGGASCEFDVVLNEVRGQGGTDYIELYNRGADPVDLVGCSITDGSPNNPNAGHRLIFPDTPTGDVLDTVIPAGEALYFQDVGDGTSCLSSNCGGFFDFGISAGGDSVFLLDPDSVVLDTIDYPDETSMDGLTNGQTLGRYPDGGEAQGAMAPTPGAPNSTLIDP